MSAGFVYGNDEFVPVILGTGLNTYNVARSLHEAFGVRSLALGRFALRETAHSSIVDVRAYRDFNRPEVVIATLRRLADELAGRTLLLVANIELYANILVEHRAELEEHYLIPLPGAALARRLMNKTDFYRTCAELGVPHPTTVVVTADAIGSPELGAGLPFAYPVILKPSDTDTYPQIRFEGKQKVYLVEDVAQLRTIVERIFAAGYTGDLVVQEYLPGDETVMRVANTYSDRHGRVRFLSVGQVVLTEYDPKAVGNNNAILTIDDPALGASIRHLLDTLGYVGPANFDVMHDRRTKESKILEVNLRQGATSYYTMAAGGNLARCYVDDQVRRLDLPDVTTTDERLWINVPYPVVLAYAPSTLRARTRAAARHGVTHTLRYSADRSPARLLDIARIDLRHTRDHLRYARSRLNR